MSTATVEVRGHAPSGSRIVRNISLAPDQDVIAGTDGEWTMSVDLKEGANELTFRLGDDSATAVTLGLTYDPVGGGGDLRGAVRVQCAAERCSDTGFQSGGYPCGDGDTVAHADPDDQAHTHEDARPDPVARHRRSERSGTGTSEVGVDVSRRDIPVA